MEFAFIDGDQLWRYVFIVTFLSVLFDFAMLSSIRISAIDAHKGRDGLRSRYFFSHMMSSSLMPPFLKFSFVCLRVVATPDEGIY